MSTKIYNAYRFTGKINALVDIIQGIKPAYIRYRIRQLLPVLPTLTLPECDIEKTIDEETKAGYDNYLNLQASVVIYLHEKKVYVQFFGIDDAFLSDALKPYRRRFKNFHYQNQSDPPSSIPEEQWNERKRVWNDIFSKHGAPVDVGLSIPFDTLSMQYYIKSSLKARQYLMHSTDPDRTERIKNRIAELDRETGMDKED